MNAKTKIMIGGVAIATALCVTAIFLDQGIRAMLSQFVNVLKGAGAFFEALNLSTCLAISAFLVVLALSVVLNDKQQRRKEWLEKQHEEIKAIESIPPMKNKSIRAEMFSTLDEYYTKAKQAISSSVRGQSGRRKHHYNNGKDYKRPDVQEFHRQAAAIYVQKGHKEFKKFCESHGEKASTIRSRLKELDMLPK
jgi:hypothetical protein